MSLMDEMKNVVNNGRELLSTVSGKMKEIDEKIDGAVNDITATITANNVINYYIDAENGDDANTGTSNSPFKTLMRAISVSPSGSNVTINLKRSQRHICNGNTRCYAGVVYIQGWGRNTDQTVNYYYDSTTPILQIEGQITFNGSVFIGSYKNTIIVEANYTEGGGDPYFYFEGAAGKFTLARSRVVLNNKTYRPFIGGEQDYLTAVKVSLREADISRDSGAFLTRRGCVISADSVTGFSYVDEIVYGATKDSIVTDIPFSS